MVTIKKKGFVCDECKKEVGEDDYHGRYSLCKSCYAKKWDEGFSSQAGHSDKMFDIQQKEERELDERLNKEDITDEDIKFFLDRYLTGTISCRRCFHRRTTWNRVEKPLTEKQVQRRIAKLKEKCPKCGVTGYLTHF